MRINIRSQMATQITSNDPVEEAKVFDEKDDLKASVQQTVYNWMKRYQQSEKGKIAQAKYLKSDKYKTAQRAAQKKYNASEKGKKAQVRYAISDKGKAAIKASQERSKARIKKAREMVHLSPAEI